MVFIKGFVSSVYSWTWKQKVNEKRFHSTSLMMMVVVTLVLGRGDLSNPAEWHGFDCRIESNSQSSSKTHIVYCATLVRYTIYTKTICTTTAQLHRYNISILAFSLLANALNNQTIVDTTTLQFIRGHSWTAVDDHIWLARVSWTTVSGAAEGEGRVELQQSPPNGIRWLHL